MKHYVAPDSFYVPQDDHSTLSSAAGNFDPQQALSSKNAWIANISTEKKARKKKILIADWTLKQDSVDLKAMYAFVKELLEDTSNDSDPPFEVYCINNGEIQPITLEDWSNGDFLNIFRNINPMHKKKLSEKMAHLPKPISADDLVILDHQAIQAVAKDNPSLLSRKSMDEMVMESDFPLEQIFRVLDDNVSLTFNSFEINRLNALTEPFRRKVKKITLSDEYEQEDYDGLIRRFPELNEIIAGPSAAIGFRNIQAPPCEMKCILPKSYDKNLLARLVEKNPKIKIAEAKSDSKNTPALSSSNDLKGTEFNFSNSEMSGKHLSGLLKACPNLKNLTLQNCKNIKDLNLSDVTLNHLTKLDVAELAISEQDLSILLKACPNLKDLTLYSCNNIKDLNLSDVTLNHLTELYVEELAISEQDLSILLKACPNLKDLFFSDCKNIKNLTLSDVTLNHLVKLNLYYSSMSNNDLSSLLKTCPNLKTLFFFSCENINDLNLSDVTLNHLTELSIENSDLSDKDLSSLLKTCPNIYTLRIQKTSTDLDKLFGKHNARFDKLSTLILDKSHHEKNSTIAILEKYAPNIFDFKCQHYGNEKSHRLENKGILTPDQPIESNQIDQKTGILSSSEAKIEPTLDCDTGGGPASYNAVSGSIVPISENARQFLIAREIVYQVHPEEKTSLIKREEITPSTFEHPAVSPKIIRYKDDLESNARLCDLYKSQYHLYDATQTIDLEPGVRYKLASLTPSDKLLKLNIIPDRNALLAEDKFTIKYCRDDHFYYLSSDIPCKITTIASIGVPKQTHALENETLKQLLKEIQNFPSPKPGEDGEKFKLSAIREDASGVAQLEAMYEQRKGSCRHRVGVFLHQFKKRQDSGAIPPGIRARGVEGPTHTWVEVSEDSGENWTMVDLGGYPAELNLTESKAETVKAESVEKLNQEEKTRRPLNRFSKKKSTPQYRDITDFLDKIHSSSKRRILLTAPNPKILNKLRNLLHWESCARKKNHIVLDQHKDFNTSQPTLFVEDLKQASTWRIQAPPSGKLCDFLGNEEKEKTVLIDWSTLSASEMVQVNTLIDDKNPHIGSVSLSTDTRIIGFITPAQHPDSADFLEDSSFTSRHDEILDFPFSETELDAALKQITQPIHKQPTARPEEKKATSPVVIDLYHSPHWERLLIGKCQLNEEKTIYIPSPLFQAIQHGAPIEIRNGPWEDNAFVRFVKDFETTGILHAYGQRFELAHPIKFTQSKGYDFKASDTIQSVSSNHYANTVPSECYVVNAEIFERCFVNETIQKDQLIAQPGWIESAPETPVPIYLTSPLNLLEWTYLLKEAKKHNKTLNLFLAKGVTLPEPLLKSLPEASIEPTIVEHKPITPMPPERQRNPIITDDMDFSLQALKKQLKTPPSPILIPASELSDEQILYSNSVSISVSADKKNEFSFEEKCSAVLQTLQTEGETVILTGPFSDNVMGHLSSAFLSPAGYIWHQGEKKPIKAKLILVTNELQPNLACLSNQRDDKKITAEEKHKALKENELKSETLETVFPECTEDQKKHLLSHNYSKIQQACRYAIAYRKTHPGKHINIQTALTGRYEISAMQEQKIKEKKEETLPDSSQSFELGLEAAQKFEVAREEAVSFMLSYSPYVFLESDAGYGKSVFIKQYAQKKGAELFSEADIGQWAQPASRQEQILFIDEANLLGRDFSEFKGLFDTPPTVFINGKHIELTNKHKVMFAGNPVSYGGGRIVPELFKAHPATFVFPPMSPAYIHQNILLPILRQQDPEGTPMFDKEAAEAISRNIFKTHGLNPRALQAEALKHSAQHYFKIKQTTLDLLNPHAPASSPTVASDYHVTTSRQPAFTRLKELFQAREFRLEMANQPSPPNEALLYGGKNAFLLDGPPGTGKSDLVKHALKTAGFEEAESIDVKSQDNKIFYSIAASCSPKEKLNLLKKAFDEGALVVMDEINSSLFAESFINAYLMGEDINGKRPKKPGFMLIGTANSAGLRGRRQLSPALHSRAIKAHLDEYSRDELNDILCEQFHEKQKNSPHDPLDRSLINERVEEFLSAQQQAKENPNQMMPTFRELQNDLDANLKGKAKINPEPKPESKPTAKKMLFSTSKASHPNGDTKERSLSSTDNTRPNKQ